MRFTKVISTEDGIVSNFSTRLSSDMLLKSLWTVKKLNKCLFKQGEGYFVRVVLEKNMHIPVLVTTI